MLERFLSKDQSLGSPRRLLLFKNIAASFLYKAVNIVTQFILVRVTLQYINAAEYGVWLTISSVLLWLSIFDFGFTNGLRNKVTQAYSDKAYESAQTYISTAYAFILLMGTAIFIAFNTVAVFIDWRAIFNAPAELNAILLPMILISFGLFCLRLVLNLAIAVLYAVHRAGFVELINMSIQLATLAGLYLWAQVESINLFQVAIIYSLAPVLVFLIYSVIIYSSYYKDLRPSRQRIDWSLFRELGSLSGKFFGLQLVSLVFFSSQNFIISRLFSPAEVTPFNLAYRYFSVVYILFNLIIVPHWSAITEAYHRHDLLWIRQTLKRLTYILVLFILLTGIMILVSGQVYDLWLGKGHIPISFLLTVTLGLNAVLMSWGNLFSLVLNSIGAITIQLITAITVLFISTPLAIYLAKEPSLGVVGVPLAFALGLVPGAILQPYQCYRVLTRSAKGIWVN